MSVSVLVSEVIERARQRCALPAFSATTFVTSTEVLDMVKASCQRLSAIVDEAWGENYFTTSGTLTTTAGLEYVSLPANFASLLRIAWVKSDTDHVMLRAASVDDWSPSVQTWDSCGGPRYRITGNTIEFWPLPDDAHTLKIYYSTGIFITATTDTIQTRNGWDEWLVLDLRIKILDKYDQDWTGIAAMQAKVEHDIRAQLTTRDRGAVHQVRDLRGASLEARRRGAFPGVP